MKNKENENEYKHVKNIFCLEGDWNDDLRLKGSIKPTLDFIEMNTGINVIYRHCATEDNFNHYLTEYTSSKYNKYKKYNILYLAFHGFPNQIQIGGTLIELEDIAEEYGELLKDKIIYFGSCLTLKIDRRKIRNFLKKTGAMAVCGYRKSIDFIPSSVLDILVIETLQNYNKMIDVEKFLKKNYSQLMNNLEFKIIY